MVYVCMCTCVHAHVCTVFQHDLRWSCCDVVYGHTVLIITQSCMISEAKLGQTRLVFAWEMTRSSCNVKESDTYGASETSQQVKALF